MTNVEFQYWIDGYLTLGDEAFLDAEQVTMIKNHANLVQTTAGEKNAGALQFANALEHTLEHLKLVPKCEVEKLVTEIFC